MALKCTKTSGPPSREMKPKPFASLNHFTVPLMRAMNRTSYRAMEPDRACEGMGRCRPPLVPRDPCDAPSRRVAALGAGRTRLIGQVLCTRGVAVAHDVPKRENGADFGPVSRWVALCVGL